MEKLQLKQEKLHRTMKMILSQLDQEQDLLQGLTTLISTNMEEVKDMEKNDDQGENEGEKKTALLQIVIISDSTMLGCVVAQ